MASFGAILPVRWITTIGVKTDPVEWSIAFARHAAKVSGTELDGEPDVENARPSQQPRRTLRERAVEVSPIAGRSEGGAP